MSEVVKFIKFEGEKKNLTKAPRKEVFSCPTCDKKVVYQESVMGGARLEQSCECGISFRQDRNGDILIMAVCQ
jgi:hypothetical protein